MKLLRDSIILCNTVSCLNVYVPCSDTNENVCKYYRFNNVTRSTESASNGGFNESTRELELELKVMLQTSVKMLMKSELKLTSLKILAKKLEHLKNLY